MVGWRLVMSLVREKAAEARSSLGQDENALALSFVMKGAVGKSVLKNRTISKIWSLHFPSYFSASRRSVAFTQLCLTDKMDS